MPRWHERGGTVQLRSVSASAFDRDESSINNLQQQTSLQDKNYNLEYN